MNHSSSCSFREVAFSAGVVLLITMFCLFSPAKAFAKEAQLTTSSIPIASGVNGTVKWSIDNAYKLTLEPVDGVSGTFEDGAFYSYSYSYYGNESNPPWNLYKDQIESVEVKPGVGFANNSSAAYVFANCRSLKTANVSNLDVSNATSLSHAFAGCYELKSIDLSRWATQNVGDFDDMFDGCSSLKNVNLSGFNTANATSLIGMFDGCSSLEALSLSGFDTAKVTSFERMFYGCNHLKTLDVSSLSTSAATNMSNMFGGCSSLVTLRTGSGWSQSQITDAYNAAMLPISMSDGETTFSMDSIVPDGQRTFTHVHTWSSWRTAEYGIYDDYGYPRYHDISEAEYRAPTCTQSGLKSRICYECGMQEHASIPATGHSWYLYSSGDDPTFILGSEQTWRCGVCWEQEVRQLPKKTMSADDNAAIATIAAFYKYAKTYKTKKMKSCFKKKPKQAFFSKGYLYKLLKKQNKKLLKLSVIDGSNNGKKAVYEINVRYRSAYGATYKAMMKSYNDLLKHYKRHGGYPSQKATNKLVAKNIKKYVKAKKFSNTSDTFEVRLVKVKGKWKIDYASTDQGLQDSVNGDYDSACDDAEESFREQYE